MKLPLVAIENWGVVIQPLTHLTKIGGIPIAFKTTGMKDHSVESLDFFSNQCWWHT